MPEPTNIRTPDDVIDGFRSGDLSIEDADKIEDLDGFTIQAKFETETGPVILTYDLEQNLSYKPNPDGDDTVRFDILND